jgi:uncharacterized protein (TIGR02391 family)
MPPPRRPASIQDAVPDADILVALMPEELGLVTLQVLASDQGGSGRLNRNNFISTPASVQGYPQQSWEAVRLSLAEAWAWLLREGLIVTDPRQGGEWVVLSRRGRVLAETGDLTAYQQARLLPQASLHPSLIQAGVTASFIRGEYDTAVFQSFRALEVHVRAKSGNEPTDIGVPLMRTAFDPISGPLRLPGEVAAEREALSHLMAGAIGLYKNPQSHRYVGLADAIEAAELVLFASHLLRTVDRIAAGGRGLGADST